MSRGRRSAESEQTAVKNCSTCEGEREHEVSIQIVENAKRENVLEENREYSRKPHVVYRCLYCDETIEERIW
jgi:recombinational DNA repair protein RecR